MTRLDRTHKKQFTSDWLSLNPDFGIHKPMWLLRIVGPFVHGIYLRTTSSPTDYLPVTFVHSLAEPSGQLFLSMFQPLLTKRTMANDCISVRGHDEKYVDAAMRLQDASLLPMTGDWHLEDIVRATKAAQQIANAMVSYPHDLYRLLLHACVWLEAFDNAETYLSYAFADITNWPGYVKAQIAELPDNMKLDYYLKNPNLIRQVVGEQLVKLKLEKLPRYELLL